MKIGGTQFPVFNPYKKSTYEIYVSGCKRKCKNCNNQMLQDFDYGKSINISAFFIDLKKRTDLYEAIAILGGDLLHQNEQEALDFSNMLRTSFPNKELWLFTGEELDDIPNWAKEIFDYIKTGCYREDLQQEGFPSSSNQKLLKRGIDYGSV